eukprot:GHVO01004817.1.p1 GENE.GHVO01004817.1~~GHVO01004817.1.p1  ORF type:complete len:231 (+),score=36.54 GHVO01004817.1:76-768(+)
MCKKDYMEIEGDDSSDEKAASDVETTDRPMPPAISIPEPPKPKTPRPKSPARSKTPPKAMSEGDHEEKLQVEGDGTVGEGSDGTPGSKKSRPRTVIKDDQLKVLHAAFTANHLPTKKEREDLVERTGLSMRVIQVWFQNKRSKERKMQKESGTLPSKEPGCKDENESSEAKPTNFDSEMQSMKTEDGCLDLSSKKEIPQNDHRSAIPEPDSTAPKPPESVEPMQVDSSTS